MQHCTRWTLYTSPCCVECKINPWWWDIFSGKEGISGRKGAFVGCLCLFNRRSLKKNKYPRMNYGKIYQKKTHTGNRCNCQSHHYTWWLRLVLMHFSLALDFPEGNVTVWAENQVANQEVLILCGLFCEFCPSAAFGTAADGTQGFPGGVICCLWMYIMMLASCKE